MPYPLPRGGRQDGLEVIKAGLRALKWALGLVSLTGVAALGLVLAMPTAESRLNPAGLSALEPGDPARGEYLLRLSGCLACHTDKTQGGDRLAGGRALASPFGTFYSPNITPDEETGIGRWSTEDFVRALSTGTAPDGSHYYPVFPYTSYTRMTLRDMVDLKAYLDTVEPVRREAAAHELRFPFSLRPAMAVWKAAFFAPGAFVPDETRSASWNRGAYLVTGPGHCTECHTPRTPLGTLSDRHLAGAEGELDVEKAPNITPHPRDGIGSWAPDDLAYALQTGIKPDGDTVKSTMGEVVMDGTSHLTGEDLDSIARYLLSLPPLENR